MNTPARRSVSAFVLILAATGQGVVSAAPETGEDFFETQIRPLLVENCFKCHGTEKQKGGLRLDSPKRALKGGDTGPAFVSGDLKASLMIRAVHYGAGEYAGEELEMPPKKKLAPEQIKLLEKWVTIGAPWPESAIADTEIEGDPRAAIREAGKTHWAFQPIRKPALPKVKDEAWVKSPIDRFVLAKLEAENSGPSPRASNRVLMRRAYLDLTGIPPTPEQAKSFMANPEFNKLSTELLENKNYGERWGRHWLDVARYADSKGAIFGEPRQYPYAYTFRDYVIRSFNEDKPFDQFVREQLAADMIPGIGKNDPSLAALGFLTVHRRSNAGGKEANWVDRVDTVSRGLLGLTVACARCHDHKFDPIPTKDFYAMLGVFASIEEPEELPVIGRPEKDSKLDREFQAFQKEEAGKLQAYIDEKHREIMKRFRGQIGDYLAAIHDGRDKDDQGLRTLTGRRKLSPEVALRWRAWFKEHPDDPVFKIWRTFAAIPEKDWKSADLTGLGEGANPVVSTAFQSEPTPASLKEVAERYQAIFTQIDKDWEKYLASNPEHPPASFSKDSDPEQLRKLLYGPEAPGVMPAGDFKKLDRPVYLALLKKNADHNLKLALHPGSPRRAMTVRDKKELYNPYVFIRGSKDRKGPQVSRRFLEKLGGNDEQPFTKGSGRLELAKAIASPDNPLTARVIVNRVWMYHFGNGLVKTPSDFGLRSEPPSHPDLLNWLASDFIEHGWSIKHLHRQIMRSSVYQQASHSVLEKFERDPDNRLLWRFNRRRMEFEAIHDSMLAAAGKLDPSRGGPASLIEIARGTSGVNDSTWQLNPYRRAVYAAVDRDKMLAQLQTFDFASPDETTSQRDITTVPTQSLFLMNSDFPMEMAGALIEDLGIHSSIISGSDREINAAIDRIYQRVFLRRPTGTELSASRDFIAGSRTTSPPKKTSTVWQFGYAPYDSKTGKYGLDDVRPFPFQGLGKMQGGPEFPDKKNGFGWLQLRSTGGHAGGGNRCQVRRWTSPVSGKIEISGELSHGSKIGDGIRATIYRNRKEQLGQWSAHNGKADTGIKSLVVSEGDVIDFVVDCIGDGSYDGFNWTPLIIPAKTIGGRTSWSPKRDFPNPPKKANGKNAVAGVFGPWEQFAQVLLMSNEFVNIE